jgi:hypothetical protein
MRVGVFLRRKPSRRLEETMEMTGAATDSLSQTIQGRLFLALFDQAARPRDHRGVLAVDGNAVRDCSALHGPATGCPRCCQRVVQLDIFGIGEPRRTRRPAVDARRDDRIPEVPVGGTVTRDDARPARCAASAPSRPRAARAALQATLYCSGLVVGHRFSPLVGAALFPAVDLDFVWPGGTFAGFEK